jgi:hypothetical protein
MFVEGRKRPASIRNAGASGRSEPGSGDAGTGARGGGGAGGGAPAAPPPPPRGPPAAGRGGGGAAAVWAAWPPE